MHPTIVLSLLGYLMCGQIKDARVHAGRCSKVRFAGHGKFSFDCN